MQKPSCLWSPVACARQSTLLGWLPVSSTVWGHREDSLTFSLCSGVSVCGCNGSTEVSEAKPEIANQTFISWQSLQWDSIYAAMGGQAEPWWAHDALLHAENIWWSGTQRKTLLPGRFDVSFSHLYPRSANCRVAADLLGSLHGRYSLCGRKNPLWFFVYSAFIHSFIHQLSKYFEDLPGARPTGVFSWYIKVWLSSCKIALTCVCWVTSSCSATLEISVAPLGSRTLNVS